MLWPTLLAALGLAVLGKLRLSYIRSLNKSVTSLTGVFHSPRLDAAPFELNFFLKYTLKMCYMLQLIF